MRILYLVFALAFFSCKKEDSPVTPDSPKSTLDSGLVAYYPFSGNANDSSTYKNHAVVYGASKTTDRYGNANSAYYFDGISAFMRVPHSESLDLTKDFSVSVWIKPEFVMPSYGDKTCIFGYGDAQSGLDPYFLYYNVLGNYVHLGTDRLDNYRDSLSTLSAHFTNIWVHVTGTWSVSTATLKIYINGQLTASRDYPQSTKEINYSTAGFVFEIGGVIGKYSFYKGAIDEVRVYNREVTAKEAAQLVFPEY